MHRVLITGASGLLGRALKKELTSSTDWDILGLGFSRVKDGLQKCDLTGKDEVEKVFEQFKPTIVIHAAAERRPEVVDGDLEAAINLNITVTEHLCNLAVKHGAFLLFISTDYVFDGTKSPYCHTDVPNPLNTYGSLKFQGEKITMSSSSYNLVLRVAMLYGHVEFLDESPVTCLYSKVLNRSNESNHDDYLLRYPTYVDDLAYIIKSLLMKKIENNEICGIFHWNGNECYTKYGMAIEMAKSYNISIDHLKAFKSEPDAKRPYNANLSNDRLEKLGISKYSKFSEVLKDCLSSFYTQ